MNKFKPLFMGMMLLVSLSVFADYAPAQVQAALKKIYPTADDVAWSQDESYYVASFVMNGFNTRVWFNAVVQWAMKQVDWEVMDEVPPAVYNAFAFSQYADGAVQNITLVQFPKWQSMVVVEVGMPNEQIKYQILFTLNGEIVRARNVTYSYDTLGASTFLHE